MVQYKATLEKVKVRVQNSRFLQPATFDVLADKNFKTGETGEKINGL